MRSLVFGLLGLVAACGTAPIDTPVDGGLVDAAPPLDASLDAAPVPWPFPLPPNFPTPRLPPDAVLTAELAELGRYLFYDVRLSGNGTQACASCHQQARAFSDGLVTPTGSTGDRLRRNAMSLTNVAFNPSQTWANPQATTLERQALIPILGKLPVELGVAGHEQEILDRLAADAAYPARFARAFPDDAAPIGWPNIVSALAAFERRLISGDAPVDRFRAGDTAAISDAAKRGQAMFFSETLECHHCHNGFNFTIAVDHSGLSEQRSQFFNTGLYNVGGTGGYPAADQGLWEFTFVDSDRGRYRPPTLRNVAVTAPYMHDGSIATLEEVLAVYERGGRLVDRGPHAGDGRANPNKSPFVGGFTLTSEQRADLLAYLRALTDDSFLHDPTLSDPFAAPPAARAGSPERP